MASVKLVCEAGKWLDQPISSIQTIRLGWLKKRALLRGSALKGEDVRQGPSVPWFGIACPTMVGCVRGTIYKVAVTVTPLRVSLDGFVERVSNEITERLKTKAKASPAGVTIWDGDDGNVVLQEIPGGMLPEVTVFITSNIARSFL